MSFNSFGHLFRVTTWGESHGPAIGCIIDGCPPRIPLTEADIQPWLDRRRPGQSRFTTQRQEPDAVRILSGVFEGATTGTPIALHIDNLDQRSKDYGDVAQSYRPGHADLAYELKYGVRDPRGGGRSSARETACRVAAGAVARLVLGAAIRIRGALVQIGPYAIDRAAWDWDQVAANPFFCPDAGTVPVWEKYLDGLRKAGSSVGAIVEVQVEGVQPGLGAPLYAKLDAELAGALMGINAVKGVEIGDGFAAAVLQGEANADAMHMQGDDLAFDSNHAGGILGGISTGQPIVVRFAVKPTSSILTKQRSVTRDRHDTEIATRGRHDPCVGIRAVPVGEAMVACVLADHLLQASGPKSGLKQRPNTIFSRRFDGSRICRLRKGDNRILASPLSVSMNDIRAADVTHALDALVDCIGKRVWATRLAALKRGCSNTYAGRALAQLHALELAIDRLRRPGRNMAPTAAELRVAHMAADLVALAHSLEGEGRTRLDVKLAEAVAEDGTLIPLFHLVHTAALQRGRGFDVTYAGLADGAPFDLLLARDGIEAEIVCDVMSAEAGRDVQRRAWSALMDRVDPDLQDWLGAHPGRYLLKLTLPNGLKGDCGAEGSALAGLHRRITGMLSSQRRVDHDEAAVSCGWIR